MNQRSWSQSVSNIPPPSYVHGRKHEDVYKTIFIQPQFPSNQAKASVFRMILSTSSSLLKTACRYWRERKCWNQSPAGETLGLGFVKSLHLILHSSDLYDRDKIVERGSVWNMQIFHSFPGFLKLWGLWLLGVWCLEKARGWGSWPLPNSYKTIFILLPNSVRQKSALTEWIVYANGPLSTRQSWQMTVDEFFS